MAKELTDEAIADLVAGLDLEGYANDFARMELGRGLAYHRARIAMLALSGRRALDAGCGVGNWMLPLAEKFEHLDALEYSRDRLVVVQALKDRFALDNVTCIEGSVEALPYQNSRFDLVFCNGVIFLTDVAKSLAEFARVLAPGGQLYVTYNGKAWWRFLIEKRGVAEPNCRLFGLDAFEDRARRLANAMHSEDLLGSDARPGVLRDWLDGLRRQSWKERLQVAVLWSLPVSNIAASRARRVATGAGHTVARTALARRTGEAILARRQDVQGHIGDLLDCLNMVRSHDEPRWQNLCDALSAKVWGETAVPRLDGVGKSIEPSEMEEMLAALGLEATASCSEGTLLVDPSAPMVAPIYRAEQGVWETLARKRPQRVA